MFAFVALMIFVSLYIKYVNGEAMNFIRNPLLVLILFAPFIPSVILLFMAKSSRKKAWQLHSKNKSEQFDGKAGALDNAKKV